MSDIRMMTVTAALMLMGGLGLWAISPRREASLPRSFRLLAVAFTLSSLLPNWASLGLAAIALVGPFMAWFWSPERRGKAVVAWSTLLITAWACFMFNSNIPSLEVGVLGFRKSALAVAGVVLACSIRRDQRRQAEVFIVRLLTFALGLSIAIHLMGPGYEQSITRAADAATAHFGGQGRLQGVFAGPFHVALAAVFLTSWALLRFRQHRLLGLVAGAVGVLALQMSLVRTAYVAVGLVVVTMIVFAPSISTGLRRMTALTVLGIAALMFMHGDAATSSVLASLGDTSSDPRLLNRLPGYQQGLQAFADSPIWGVGTGSAGDTLGAMFPPGHFHVTPHNILLKVAVEGGLILLTLWAGLVTAMIRSANRRTPLGQLALVTAVGFLVLGSTGSAIETLPVSYLLFVVVGLAVDDSPHETSRREGAQESDDLSARIHSWRGGGRRVVDESLWHERYKGGNIFG